MRPPVALLLGLAVAYTTPRILAAQEPSDSSTDEPAAANTLVPLPAVFYQPETGTGFGLVTTYYFRIGTGRTVSDQPSSAQLIAVYTTKKQIVLQLSSQLYTAERRNWIFGQLEFSKFPNKYWGVGNATPDGAEEDYTPRLLQAKIDVQRRIAPALYVGASVQAGHRAVLARADTGLLATGEAPGSSDGRIIGGGVLATYDTRSSVIYPRSGSLLQFRASGYSSAIGSSYDFATFTLDLRRYVTTFPSHVVALRAYGVATTGAPPFDLLPQVGGDVLLRGYFQGRFRDRNLVALQAEYRAPLIWRIGVVGFGAAGRVANRLDAFALDGIKVSAGGGLRFLLSRQEGLNIRADFAYGFDVKSSGFYLAIGEAF